MKGFVSVVKKTKTGIFYIDLPKELMKEMNLKPFMAAEMKAEKGRIIILGFGKTVKIKIDLSKKTLAMLKKIMKEEGYASLDETISNIIRQFLDKNKKEKTHNVYLYPEKFLQSNCILINDFEKNFRKTRKRQS